MKILLSIIFGLIVVTPSIKLIVNSPILNIAFSVVLILSIIVGHKKLSFLQKGYSSILLAMISYIFVIHLATLSINGVLRVLNWSVFIFAAMIFRNHINRTIVVNVVKINGMVLSILIILNVQITSSEYGSYLTLSLPVGMAIIASLYDVLEAKSKLSFLLNLAIWMLGLTAVMGLLSRSVIIYTVLLSLVLFLDKLRPERFIGLLSFIVVLGFRYWTIIEQNLAQFDRLRQLFETGDEARLDLYQRSWDFLIEGWLVFGSGAIYIDRIGYYPHNVFIEAFLIGGIPLLILFSFLLFFLLRNSRDALFYTGCFGLLQWLSSFEFWTTYIFLIPLILNDFINRRPYVSSEE